VGIEPTTFGILAQVQYVCYHITIIVNRSGPNPPQSIINIHYTHAMKVLILSHMLCFLPCIFDIGSSILLYPTVLKRNASLGGGPGGGPGAIRPRGRELGGPGGIIGGGNLKYIVIVH
jgi:hypothetical protein